MNNQISIGPCAYNTLEELIKDKPELQTPIKKEQSTAIKETQSLLFDQNHNSKIRNFIFSLFKNDFLRGHFKVQNFDSLQIIEIILYHKIKNICIQQSIRLFFGKDFPKNPPKLCIHSCNLSSYQNQYIIPEFLTLHEELINQKWNQNVKLSDVIAKIYQNIDNFHKSEVERLISHKQQIFKENVEENYHEDIEEKESHNSEKIKRQRRKSSNMTGCADKQLTQTKNLNRHFRSKLREVLRDLVTPEEMMLNEDYKFVDEIFTPNRVGFEDIRKALRNKWFNQGVRRQMNSGQFLHKILRGMMGIKSKKLMIKYYHVMISAVQEPSCFIRWKYD